MLIKKKIKDIFNMNDELMILLEDNDLKKDLSDIRSNTIGGQIYCIAGARESYGVSIINDTKFNWICKFSYEKRFDSFLLSEYLFKWRDEVIKYLSKKNELSSNQEDLLLDLYAHEYMHQGQLIRYLYGNNIKIPKSWKDFWHLSD